MSTNYSLFPNEAPIPKLYQDIKEMKFWHMKIWEKLYTKLCNSEATYGPEEERWVRINKERSLERKWDGAMLWKKGSDFR